MTKEEKYQTIVPQIQALMAGETDEIAKMANMVAVLHETFGFWWTGFYRVERKAGVGELVLGPFQGPIASPDDRCAGRASLSRSYSLFERFEKRDRCAVLPERRGFCCPRHR